MKHKMFDRMIYKPGTVSLPFCNMLKNYYFKYIYDDAFRLSNAVRVSY